MLHENVDGFFRDLEPVKLPCHHLAQQRSLLQKIIACKRKEAPLGNSAAPVPCTAHTLHGYGNCARGLDLTHQIDGADIDAEFERRGCDQDFDLAVFQALFSIQAQRA